MWRALALLMVGLLGGCKGIITSTEPLLTPRNASFPLTSGTQVTGQRLGDNNIWEEEERKARVVLVDGYYRIIDPDRTEPGSERFLFKAIGDGQLIVQASNANEWAYALIVRADRYYLFTFNRDDQNCTNLSDEERHRLHVIISDDRCLVGDLRELTALLRHLRTRFAYPTSAFAIDRSATGQKSE